VIEQLTITTTPKYNFPQENINLELPRTFLELSIQSIKTSEKTFNLNNLLNFQQLTITTLENLNCLSAKVIKLKPKPDNSIVSAIDVSSIKLGETSTGFLLAIRGAIVWKQNVNYRYLRIGPFLFHVTEENKQRIYNVLRKAYFNFAHQESKAALNITSTPNIMQMQSRLTGLLEKWLQMTLTTAAKNTLILWDGSLTVGTPETPTRVVESILQTARKRENMIMAFSKATRLRLMSHRITDLLVKSRPPCLLELKGYSNVNRPIRLLGEIYVARLAKGNCTFRLDIDKEIPSEQRIEAVEKLLGNDIVSHGYPETLRLAHILCTFTANEVIAMQRFIAKKAGLNIVSQPNIRRILFGPYGKGEVDNF
jgi:hypothetical protein